MLVDKLPRDGVRVIDGSDGHRSCVGAEPAVLTKLCGNASCQALLIVVDRHSWDEQHAEHTNDTACRNPTATDQEARVVGAIVRVPKGLLGWFD